MFTGIVEEVGVLRAVERRGDVAVFQIECRKVIRDLAIGDSIAVNGACLTAVAVRSSGGAGDEANGAVASGNVGPGGDAGDIRNSGVTGDAGDVRDGGDRPDIGIVAGGFDVELVPETLRRTALGRLAPGQPVNLERSLAADGRFGGHVVQGHVDATGTVVEVSPDGEGGSRLVRIRAPRSVLRHVVVKGYVAIDGTSLTVVDVDDAGDTFDVALIPHTLAHTIAGGYATGTPVNLEADILGKYIERLLADRIGAPDSREVAG